MSELIVFSFENETGALVERSRTAHGQVVNGAVHRQRADISPGKEQGLDDKGIGRNSQTCAIYG